MKIFVLEDMPERIKWFATWCMENQATMVCANHADDAAQVLSSIAFDAIFLDHDLGGQVYVERHEPNTGYSLCYKGWDEPNVDVPVIIHSWNYDGSTSMARKLKDEGYRGQVTIAPFGEEDFMKIVSGMADRAKGIVEERRK